MELFLKTARHIARPHWLLASETIKLFEMLQGDIPENDPQALFVGGSVRNAVLDFDVEDFDIATPLTPDEVVQILEKSDIRVIPTGIDHGTVTAVLGEHVYEITTLRKDTETDGRRAVVDYTSCWVEDAERRDFTINTLLMDLKGNIYDPLGTGLPDLEKKHVRFVGDASKRIEEDYLRILRFLRFSALYGDGQFDEDGLKACQKAADKIQTLSRERITQEFFKIIASEKPYDVLCVMFENDILKDIEFATYDPQFFEAFCGFQKRYNLVALSARLYVFTGMTIGNIQAMEKYILFPKVFLKDIRSIEDALKQSDLSCDQAVRESVYRFGRSVTAQVLMIELAQDRVMNAYAPKALEIIQNWDVPDFPVTGEDLIAEGFKPGPELGAELTRREEEWIKSGFN